MEISHPKGCLLFGGSAENGAAIPLRLSIALPLSPNVAIVSKMRPSHEKMWKTCGESTEALQIFLFNGGSKGRDSITGYDPEGPGKMIPASREAGPFPPRSPGGQRRLREKLLLRACARRLAPTTTTTTHLMSSR